MEFSFFIYILCVVIILTILVCYIVRKERKCEYRKSCLNNGKPLKYIPKKIFQLVEDKSKVPVEFKENINFIKSLNPNWKYTLYDDQDIKKYIRDNYGEEMLKYYNKINPKYGPARADFFRYLLIYKEGGAYFDIKSAATLPLDTIILPDDEYILSHWDSNPQCIYVNNIRGEYQQWYIIAKPKHPFLKEVIDKVLRNIDNYTVHRFGIGKDGVLRVTGPIIYTNAISPILNNHNHRFIDLNDFTGLNYNNIQKSHVNLFNKTHYSKLTEPIIISANNKDE
jgi:mannosyltransferase OCH1-like enzyme